MRRKLAFIGAGQIGGTMAHMSITQDLGDVVLLDVADGVPQGKGLDLCQALAVEHVHGYVHGGQDYSLLKDADVVIITAGIPRKPGMQREELLSINAKVMKTVAGHVKTYCPGAFVIIVTNPLDAMVAAFQHYSGLPAQKVVGMAGVLDSARMAFFLAEAMNIAVGDVQTFVLGGHGDTMVPMPRFTSVAGIPLPECVRLGLISQDKVDQIIDRTRNGGAEIVNLLKTGSAFYAPATSALAMAKSYLYDQRRILPAAAQLSGQYGLKGLYVGVPVIVGANGVEKIIELELTADERQAFMASVTSVQSLMQDLQKIDPEW